MVYRALMVDYALKGYKHKNYKPKAKNTACTQELWIKNGKRHIYGELFTPPNAKKKAPVAIIAHGFNGTHEYGRNYYETLGQKG